MVMLFEKVVDSSLLYQRPSNFTDLKLWTIQTSFPEIPKAEPLAGKIPLQILSIPHRSYPTVRWLREYAEPNSWDDPTPSLIMWGQGEGPELGMLCRTPGAEGSRDDGQRIEREL
jgi:hypothetical protein